MKHSKFIFFSLSGFIFFLLPITIGSEEKILLSHIVSFITENYMDIFLIQTQLISWIVILGTLLFSVFKTKNDLAIKLFVTSPINKILRISGGFLYLMVLNQWFAGSHLATLILDPNTGGLMAGSGGLLTTLYITFFAGILAIPLLTNFGAVEFIGIMTGKVVEKLFKVPGYSAVDAIASFVGDGTIGIVVTDNQYKKGYYNRREAYIIATSFSIVGIAFAAAVAEELMLGHIFPIFYGSIALVTIIIAFITARLPLSKFEPTYYKDIKPTKINQGNNQGLFSYAVESASTIANQTSIKESFKNSLLNIAEIYIGFLPIIMLVGTLSLVVAEHFSFFQTISQPLVPLYTLIGYSPQIAETMASASLVGFADMYLPSLFVVDLPSESARFFIGVLAFTQLVFMSETGMILVKARIGLTFWDVIKVFFLRTALSFPILLLITRLLVNLGYLTF